MDSFTLRSVPVAHLTMAGPGLSLQSSSKFKSPSHAHVNWTEKSVEQILNSIGPHRPSQDFSNVFWRKTPYTLLRLKHLQDSVTPRGWNQRTEQEDYERLFAEAPTLGTVATPSGITGSTSAWLPCSPFSCLALQGSLKALDLTFHQQH